MFGGFTIFHGFAQPKPNRHEANNPVALALEIVQHIQFQLHLQMKLNVLSNVHSIEL